MSVFGVSPAEEEMYRLFLRAPDTRLDEIALRLRTGPDTVRRSLERLYRLGLLRRDAAARTGFAAEDPDAALTRLMDQRMHELHDELRRITRARPLIDALRAEMRPPAANGATTNGATTNGVTANGAAAQARTSPPRGVERLTELAQIRGRIDDLAFFARDEILSVQSAAEPTPEELAHTRALDLRSLRRGVRVRIVVPAKTLGHRPVVDHLRVLAAEGALIRVAAEVTERILVYDRRTAVVPVDTERPARGTLFAYEGGLVTHIVALFERIWGQAEDLLTALEERPPAAPNVSERERRVLASMVSVGKDESGARDLGISVRTYRRHVADLMRRLGAASRAQAALLARDHGWI